MLTRHRNVVTKHHNCNNQLTDWHMACMTYDLIMFNSIQGNQNAKLPRCGQSLQMLSIPGELEYNNIQCEFILHQWQQATLNSFQDVIIISYPRPVSEWYPMWQHLIKHCYTLWYFSKALAIKKSLINKTYSTGEILDGTTLSCITITSWC